MFPSYASNASLVASTSSLVAPNKSLLNNVKPDKKYYFIWITGVPGIGKSYLCSMLTQRADVKCYDADDVYAEVLDRMLANTETNKYVFRHDQLLKSSDNKWNKNVWYHEQDEVISRLRPTDKHFVLVGIPVDLTLNFLKNRPDLELCMGVVWDKDTFDELYRRYMRREASKLANTIAKVQQLIDSTPRDEMDRLPLHISIATRLAGTFPRSYYEYLNNYIQHLTEESKYGVQVRTQEDIVVQLGMLFDGQLDMNKLKGNKTRKAGRLGKYTLDPALARFLPPEGFSMNGWTISLSNPTKGVSSTKKTKTKKPNTKKRVKKRSKRQVRKTGSKRKKRNTKRKKRNTKRKVKR